MPKKFLRIAIGVPLNRLFDYLPPKNQPIHSCAVGARIMVPFGHATKIGLIMGHAAHSDIAEEKIRPASALLDEQPLLNATHLDFLRWVARYYHHPIGEVVISALPLRLRKHKAALPINSTYCELSMAPAEALELTRRAPKQQAIVRNLACAEQYRCDTNTLRQQFTNAHDTLKRLAEKNIVKTGEQKPQPSVPQWVDKPFRLNAEQTAAINTVKHQLDHFAAFLLEGITGSGKTEVYLQLSKTVLQQGKNILLLVPEISLTPQLAQGFRERLGDCVAVMHSALSDAQRELNWHSAKLGLSRLILGTRSLIFNPIDQLGLVIVDEEHDPSFKQQEGLRYSARDLAIIRAQRANCPVLLGSATPSLESLHNANRGRYRHLRLTRRAGNAQPPRMHILDIRDQSLQAGVSKPLLTRLRKTLAQGQQALIFINRRGYAPVLSCADCTWVSACDRCDAHQTVHRAAHQLVCHHCGAQRRIPAVCPDCGSTELQPLGQGTEKIEDFLRTQFPDTPLIRIDRDTTTRKDSLAALLEKVHRSDAALLVGTQILAKGHHFPKVTLVCVLNADAGLFSADFRATERMAQLLMQVAGRAGRDNKPGQVVIQSRYPDHPLLQVLVNAGYPAFAAAALAERMEANYPPFSYQILIRAEARKAENAEALLGDAAKWIQARRHQQSIHVWGPVPAPMARKMSKYRSHLLIQSKQREILHDATRQLAVHMQSSTLNSKVRWNIDVDPYDSY